MTEPVGDRDQVDPGVQKVEGGRVTKTMRVNAFATQGRSAFDGVKEMLFQDPAYAESREGLTEVILKDVGGVSRSDLLFREQCLQQTSRLGPNCFFGDQRGMRSSFP